MPFSPEKWRLTQDQERQGARSLLQNDKGAAASPLPPSGNSQRSTSFVILGWAVFSSRTHLPPCSWRRVLTATPADHFAQYGGTSFGIIRLHARLPPCLRQTLGLLAAHRVSAAPRHLPVN